MALPKGMSLADYRRVQQGGGGRGPSMANTRRNLPPLQVEQTLYEVSLRGVVAIESF